MSIRARVASANSGIHSGGVQGFQGPIQGLIPIVSGHLQQEMKSATTGTAAMKGKHIHSGCTEGFQRGGQGSRFVREMDQESRLVVARGGIQGGPQHKVAGGNAPLFPTQDDLGGEKHGSLGKQLQQRRIRPLLTERDDPAIGGTGTDGIEKSS